MADNYPYQAAAASSVAALDEFPSYDYDIDSLTNDPQSTTAVNNPFSPQNSPRDIFSNAKFFDFDLNSDIGAAMGPQHNLNFSPGMSFHYTISLQCEKSTQWLTSRSSRQVNSP